MRFFYILLALFYATGALALPQGSVGIAAVVDDQVISTIDLNDRIGLIIGMSGLPDNQESRARLGPQILRQLIDEHLQMEEATRDGITINDTKLHEGIARIEAQSNKPPGSLEAFLTSKGLSKPSFYAQIRAQMAWSEVILKKIRPRIRISDQEVARYAAHKAQSPAKAEEVQIATIQLPVDSPDNEASTHALADKLAGEIRSGLKFDAVASQFASASGGKPGEPFWVEVPQLDPLIAAALVKITPGTITDPVRTASGYQIIQLLDKRAAQAATIETTVDSDAKAELAFKQILMTLKPDAKTREAELLLSLAKEVQRAPGKCEDKSIASLGDLSDFDFKVSMVRSQSSDLPEKLRNLLMSLSVGTVSEPVVTPQGIRLFMLCERIDLPAPKLPPSMADEKIRQSIYEQKMELEVQKYLRNLRREAFIEVRMH